MTAYDPAAYGDAFADVYDDWYGQVTDAEATADAVAALADGGPVLELGIGTGRLALPIAARGLAVHGIDASEPMLERLRTKPGADAVVVHRGDFTEVALTPPGDGYAVVLVGFNTLLNLPTADAQARCVARSAEVLRPGGHLVIEMQLLDGDVLRAAPDQGREGSAGSPGPGVAGRRARHRTDVDLASQTVSGSIETPSGVRPWRIRWLDIDELDAMAVAAGLEPEGRWATWAAAPWTPADETAISLFRRVPG